MRGGGQNNSSRPPPSGGVAAAQHRVITAKDIKVIKNNPSESLSGEKVEKLARKDSKLGRKETLQMNEKENAQMTKSKCGDLLPIKLDNKFIPQFFF